MWDGKTGEALTTLTSERLLENDQADITAFSLDHQVRCITSSTKSVHMVSGFARARLSYSETPSLPVASHVNLNQRQITPCGVRRGAVNLASTGAQAGRRCGHWRHPCVLFAQWISYQAPRSSQWASQLAVLRDKENGQVSGVGAKEGRKEGRVGRHCLGSVDSEGRHIVVI